MALWQPSVLSSALPARISPAPLGALQGALGGSWALSSLAVLALGRLLDLAQARPVGQGFTSRPVLVRPPANPLQSVLSLQKAG